VYCSNRQLLSTGPGLEPNGNGTYQVALHISPIFLLRSSTVAHSVYHTLYKASDKPEWCTEKEKKLYDILGSLWLGRESHRNHSPQKKPKMKAFDKSSTLPPAQKGSKTSSSGGPSPSKRQSLRDALLNFGKPNYAPLTPIEILPGIMSTDGVATVFQLDTRKPKTKRQVEKMEREKKKRSLSAAVRNRQMQEGARGEWQDALQPGLQEGYFGSGSGKDPNKPSLGKSLVRSGGADDFAYEQLLNLQGFRRKDRGKDVKGNATSIHTSKLDPPYPTSTKPGLSPTDKLTVRHANPFTGLLSRNQTELNVSRYDDEYPPVRRKPLDARITGGLPLSPPYPHSRSSYPTVSSPSLSSSAAAAFEDLIPMPSVHEPAPFSFPGATAEEIEAYERALQIAASNVANHLTVPPLKKSPTVQHLSENERGASKGRGDHFLALDGGLEQQAEQGWRTKDKKARRTSSLQNRHLKTPALQDLSTTPPLPPTPTYQYPSYEGPAPPPENLLQSASNRDYQSHKHPKERRTSTSISTMRGKGDTHTLQLGGGENRVFAAHTPQHCRMGKVKSAAPKAGGVTGAAAGTGVRGEEEGVKMLKRTGSGPGLALFNMSVPFVDPRELADYRRARAGLPPLKEKEGWAKQKRVEYKAPFPFKFEFESPPSTSVSESECECVWNGKSVSGGTLGKVKEGQGVNIKDTAKTGRSAKPPTEKGVSKDYTFKAVLTQLHKSLELVPCTFDLSLPPAMKEAICIVMAFLEPVLTLNAPPQFWKLPILLRVLLGLWYFVIVTWGILVVVRVVGIIGEMVGLVMVPVRGVVWVARVICGG